jgi:hypothetical protein
MKNKVMVILVAVAVCMMFGINKSHAQFVAKMDVIGHNLQRQLEKTPPTTQPVDSLQISIIPGKYCAVFNNVDGDPGMEVELIAKDNSDISLRYKYFPIPIIDDNTERPMNEFHARYLSYAQSPFVEYDPSNGNGLYPIIPIFDGCVCNKVYSGDVPTHKENLLILENALVNNLPEDSENSPESIIYRKIYNSDGKYIIGIPLGSGTFHRVDNDTSCFDSEQK